MKTLIVPLSILVFLISISLSVQGQANSSLDSKLALQTDLSVPAGAMPLRLQRRPASTKLQRGSLGTHWRHNWESRLTRSARRVQIEDWTGITSFTQVDKSLV